MSAALMDLGKRYMPKQQCLKDRDAACKGFTGYILNGRIRSAYTLV
jgi:hypothetical protein